MFCAKRRKILLLLCWQLHGILDLKRLFLKNSSCIVCCLKIFWKKSKKYFENKICRLCFIESFMVVGDKSQVKQVVEKLKILKNESLVERQGRCTSPGRKCSHRCPKQSPQKDLPVHETVWSPQPSLNQRRDLARNYLLDSSALPRDPEPGYFWRILCFWPPNSFGIPGHPNTK